jgi:uncharacterized Fe-S cluster-containing radical SAM superfamily protein
MSRGELVHGCDICYNQEAVGERSFRFRTALLAGIAPTQSKTDTVIRGLDLRVGNTCNLQCIMCSLTDSNSWHKIYGDYAKYVELMPDIKIQRELNTYDPKNLDWVKYESSWQNIFCSIDNNVKMIYLAGGEPFYINNFELYLSELVSRCPDAQTMINTNATRLLKSSYIDSIKGHDILTRISLDGIGATDEYIRQGTVWDEKVEVIKQYSQIFRNITFDVTLSSLNILKLPETLEWIRMNYPTAQILLRPVVNRPSIKINSVPLERRREVYDYLKAFAGNDLNNKPQIMALLLEETDLSYIDHANRLVNFFDLNGNLSYAEVDQPLRKYINDSSSN